MFSGRLLFAGYRAFLVLVLVLVLFSVNCHAQINSCGDIHNISFPFRLKSDPNDNCGVKDFELACEYNRTILYLLSGKYYVQSTDFPVRLVDVGIQRNSCSSLPLHSLSLVNFTYAQRVSYFFPWRNGSLLAVFMNCENPVLNNPLYIDIPDSCENGSVSSSNILSSNSSLKRHSYVLVADQDFEVSDLAELCIVDTMVMFSGSSSSKGNISFLDLHNKLANGFELSWDFMSCEEHNRQKLCFDDAQNITSYCQEFCFDDAQNITTNCPDYTEKKRTIPAIVVHQLHYYLETIFVYNYWFVLKIIGPILAARFLCAFAFLVRKFRRRHLSMVDGVEGFLRSQNNLMPINYSYWEIKKMTKGFKDKLGEGGYGSVYKGKLRSGQFVAIKVLGKSRANGQDFINEVASIGRIHHTNVVRLIGFCAEGSKCALVYDFMPNGSLEKYIFSKEGNVSLSCKQMYEISLGVACGIAYLHQGCDMQILHFDIKPHNILLDENFTPKVSDFGLAKLYPTEVSIVSLTAARGTLGYMAPELFYKNIGGVSYKADVYSFGMLLMEMAGRRRNWNASANSSQIYFPSWIYDQFTEGKQVEMGEATEGEREMVKKMMVVALWCIQMKPSDRPSMNKVVEMLEGNIENHQMPPKPFLYPEEPNLTMFPNLSGACLDSITLEISAR